MVAILRGLGGDANEAVFVAGAGGGERGEGVVIICNEGGVRFAELRFDFNIESEFETAVKELAMEDDSPRDGTGIRGSMFLEGTLGNGGNAGSGWLLCEACDSAREGTGGIVSFSLPLNRRMKPLFLCLSCFDGMMAGSESRRSGTGGGTVTNCCSALLALVLALIDLARERRLVVCGLTFDSSGKATELFAVALRVRSRACACASARDMSCIVGEPGCSIHPPGGRVNT